MADRITREELNRATLARQLLLQRSTIGPIEAVHHLVGLQAQAPWSPYYGLLSRLDGFVPDDLGRLLLDRTLVRVVTLRGTIHLMTVPDAAGFRPLVQPLLERHITAQRERREALRGAELDAIAGAGEALLSDEALTPAELGDRLAERFPGVAAEALATVVRNRVPTVQTTPRAVWGERGTPRLRTLAAWVATGPHPVTFPEAVPLDEVVRRYLTAFGPASVKDVQVWCGLTKLRKVVDAMGDQLVRFVDDDGVDLYDLPDAPRPGAGVDAPVRLLADFDNLLLSHADRRRFLTDEDRKRLASLNGIQPATVLIDGRVAGRWRIERAPHSTQIVIEPWKRLSRSTRPGLRREAERVIDLVAPEAEDHDVRIMDP